MEIQRINDCTSKANMLITALNLITSFEDVKKWDKEAHEEISFLKKKMAELQDRERRITNDIPSGWKNFFKRIAYMKRHGDVLNHIKEDMIKIPIAITSLSEWIELTPDSQDEKELLIKELKEKKQSLVFTKKDFAMLKKSTNATYKNKVASNAFLHPKFRSMNNRIAKATKDAQTNNINEAIHEIDTLLLRIDKLLYWYNRLS